VLPEFDLRVAVIPSRRLMNTSTSTPEKHKFAKSK